LPNPKDSTRLYLEVKPTLLGRLTNGVHTEGRLTGPRMSAPLFNTEIQLENRDAVRTQTFLRGKLSGTSFDERYGCSFAAEYLNLTNRYLLRSELETGLNVCV